MFAEFVCGPPGSGKTTYCEGKRQFLSVYDPQRPVIIVNLDPANDSLFPYPCDIDVRQFVSHREVASMESLGPNGSYLFCAEVVAMNADLIVERIAEVALGRSSGVSRPPYVIIDAPGQIEFYLMSDVIEKMSTLLQKVHGCNVCLVHLVDSSVVTSNLDTYVSTALMALSVMVAFELPHVNVMNKWDLISSDEREVFLSTSSVLESFMMLSKESVMTDRTARLARAMLETVDGYGIVGFIPLAVQDQSLMLNLTVAIDAALGNFS